MRTFSGRFITTELLDNIEGNQHLEQIPVNRNIKLAFLQFRQTFCIYAAESPDLLLMHTQ